MVVKIVVKQDLMHLTRCLLYTSDAADDSLRVDLGGRRIIKKKKKKKIIINFFFFSSRRLHTIFFFFKQKTAYEIGVRLVGSEMCIRDRATVNRLAGGSNPSWGAIPTIRLNVTH